MIKRRCFILLMVALIAFPLFYRGVIFASQIDDIEQIGPMKAKRRKNSYSLDQLGIKSLVYTNHDSIIIYSDDDFVTYGFSGSGSEFNPYIIENYNITTTDSTGILIEFVSSFFIIRNCLIKAELSGIYLADILSGSARIINNTVVDCNNHGIAVFVGQLGIINNTVINNDIGISTHNANNSTIRNNYCYDNNIGMVISSSPYSIIESNTIRDNIYGIEIRSEWTNLTNNYVSFNSYRGIDITHSAHSNITSNVCIKNEYQAIFVDFIDICDIERNYISNTTVYGIWCSDSTTNVNIAKNVFLFNNFDSETYLGSQACDDGSNNIWYDQIEGFGNYWADWDGNGDYLLDGTAASVDLYPQIYLYNDTDNDGMLDAWENLYGLNIGENDSGLDPDTDGLTNLEEFLNGTNPTDADSDDDGLNDGDEVNTYNTNPLKSDTDDDGLNDYEEIFTYQTNPLNEDTDGDGRSDHWEIMNGFDPLSYNYLFIKNVVLRYTVYIGPFVLIFMISVVLFMIKRRKNTRKLIEYLQEQKEQLILLKGIILETNQRLTVNVNEIAEPILAISQVIVSNTNLINKPKKLYRLMRKNWSRKFFNKQGMDTLLLEIFEGFVVSSEKFDYSVIQTPIEKSEKMIEDTKDPDIAFRTLDEVKSVIKKNLQMVEQMNTIFNYHSIYLSPIEEEFTKSIFDIKSTFSIYESQISKLERSKTDSEFKFKEIERIKTIEKVLQHETRVSMDKMIDFLDFQTSEELEKWLLDNFSSVPYLIEDNEIVFKTKEDKTEIMEAIDSLLKEYETWTDEGMGKKK